MYHDQSIIAIIHSRDEEKTMEKNEKEIKESW